VAGTAYDFAGRTGSALGAQYLDDCFVALTPTAGFVSAEILDPAAAYGLRVTAAAPPVRAFQVYAPPQEAFVALEPQLNWADPYAPQWTGHDTGMALIPPGGSLSYRVTVSLLPMSMARAG
jgi:galactose mutarotase-like enzyme